MNSEPNPQMNLTPRRLKLSVGLFGLAVLLLTLAACGDEDDFTVRGNALVEAPPSSDGLFVAPLPPDDGPHRPPHLKPGPNGIACAFGTQCVSGNCVDGACCASASCPTAEFCNTGQCAPPAPNGAFCTDDGAQCESGFCVDFACCSAELCPAGEFCSVPGREGQCSALPTPTPAGIGAPCADPAQCSSGNCVDWTCCSTSSCPDSESCNVYPDAGHCHPRPTAPPTRTRLPTPIATPQPITLRVGSAAGPPGDEVTFAVFLDTAIEVLIAGTQNDLLFDSMNTPITATGDGTPDCFVNPVIHKDSSAFAFLPAGCTGTACTRVRALVFATDNLDPIPPGSVLYSCRVDISLSATDGEYPLAITGVVVSTPNGLGVLDVGSVNGRIVVSGDPPPPQSPSSEVPSIVLGTTAGSPGGQVTFNVTLSSPDIEIAGAQNDIAFDCVNTPIAAKANDRPDCAVNPAIHKDASVFGFRYTATGCREMRAIVIAVDNVDPIPDGSVLYTCRVDISAGAADGEYPLAVSHVVVGTPQGVRVVGTTGIDGAVVVEAR